MYKINFFYIAAPPAVFDFEEQFSYAGGWPGVFENVNYDWNPADGEESLATPDFQENDFTYTSDWPGVFENVNYDWNPADGEESLATPDFQEDFDTITGGW